MSKIDLLKSPSSANALTLFHNTVVGSSFLPKAIDILWQQFLMSWPPWLGSGLALHPVAEMGVLITLEDTNHPNPFPIGNKFG